MSSYDILASMLVPLEYWDPTELNAEVVDWLLRQAEANHYLSCPAVLLHAARSAAHMSFSRSNQEQRLQQSQAHLLDIISSFDPISWAVDLQKSSPCKDLIDRTHLASAHKAAIHIYVCRVMNSSMGPGLLENQVKEIIHHIGSISSGSALIKATPWPIFIAGAESTDQDSRSLIADKLYSLWTTIHWGYVRNALKILESRWQQREGVDEASEPRDWTRGLSTLGYQWFIC